MTTSESCALLADTVCQLSAARWESERWRLLALKAIQEYANLARDHQMVSEPLYRRITERLLAERDELLEPRPRTRVA